MKDQIDEATTESKNAFDQAEKFVNLISELQGKRYERDARENNVRDIEKHMKAMPEADQELKTMNDNFDERVARLDEDVKGYTRKYHDLDAQINENRDELGVKQGQLGRFQAERDNYERQIEHRETLVKESARRHNIRGFDYEVDDDQVRKFMEKVGKMARDQNAALDRVRRESQDEYERAQKALTSLQQRHSTIEQRKENAKSQISVNDGKISDHRRTINKISIDEGGKARLESSIADIKNNLERMKTTAATKQWEQSINEAKNKVETYDHHAEKLNDELVQATKQAGETARFDYLKKQYKESDRSLETMKGAHGDRISDIVGTSWQPKTLEGTFQDIVEAKVRALKEAEAQRDGMNRELEHLNFRLNLMNGDLKQKRHEQQICFGQLQDVLGDEHPNDYPDIVDDCERKSDILKSDLNNLTHLSNYYMDCLTYSQDKKGCRLCQRGFRHDSERSGFEERLKKYLRQNAKDETEKELKDVEDDLKQLNSVRPKYDTWKRLNDGDIPNLEAERKKLEPKRDDLNRKAENEDNAVSEKASEKEKVESMTKTIQNMSKYANDIASFEVAIQELSAKQVKAGLSRGLEDINGDIKSVKEKTAAARTRLSNLTGEQDDGKSEVNRLELELRDAQSNLTNAEHQLKDKTNVISLIDDLSGNNEQQRENIQLTDREMQELRPQILQSEFRLDDIRQRGDSKESSLKDEASKLSNTVNQLQLADRDINAYVDKNSPNQLSRCEAEIQNLQQDIEDLEQERRKVTTSINKLGEQKSYQDKIKRDIEDNLRFRKNSKELESYRAEIARLEGHNAEADRDGLQAQGHDWQNKRNRLSADQAEIVGEMKSKDVELERELENFNTFYQDASYKYREAHIRVEATKAAVDDLGRYGGALDKAIMQYHSLKMEEINRIIEELWRRTYQGTDVDTILIRSDNENLKGNKIYNYRVCMVKQDAEMDMRGRCSAGQKVLASIIIRLALAECFGTRCGIIALDEPTTNLDRENIRALAESIHQLIKDRKQQPNFQLVIITHDEEFLRYMRCEDYCDNYWRVKRGADQTSEIDKQSVDLVVG